MWIVGGMVRGKSICETYNSLFVVKSYEIGRPNEKSRDAPKMGGLRTFSAVLPNIQLAACRRGRRCCDEMRRSQPPGGT